MSLAFALFCAAVTTGVTATTIADVATAPDAEAATAFSCAADTVYGLQQAPPHQISRINPTTGAAVGNGNFVTSPLGPSSQYRFNSLALPPGGGRYIYAYERNFRKVARFDATTDSTSQFDAPGAVGSNGVVTTPLAGAIDPVSGFYYYATPLASGVWNLYAFNTTTNTAVGQVGTINGLASNGDIAFDGLGNLYVVSNETGAAGTLVKVDGPLPTTAGTGALASATITSTPAVSGQYHSMAFDSTGALVIGSGPADAATTTLTRVNPASGATLSNVTSSASVTDLASCTNPNSVRGRKTLPNGRFASGDQFTLTVSGNGVTTDNVGTTTGADPGLQSDPAEVAGPVLALDGGTYTVTETAAGTTDVANYASSWSCVDAANGNAALASGTGRVATVTVPTGAATSDVVCTFTNNPLPPPATLRVQKALPDGRVATGDQFGLAITGPSVPAGTTVTTTGTGSTATGTATYAAAARGTAYTITETGAAGADLRSYTSSYSCVDTANGNAAVASGSATTGSVTIPTTGANVPNVLCTFSNSPVLTPGITLTKTASSATYTAGQTLTYTFVASNTGQTSLSNVSITDTGLPGVTITNASCTPAAPATLAPNATLTCTATKTMSQADVNAGAVTNTANATGTPPTGPPVSDTDDETVTAPSTPAIDLVKTASSATYTAGQTLTYTFVARNTGNVSLSNVSITDTGLPGVTITNASCTPAAPATLAPNATLTCTATKTMTQADVNAGSVVNTARTQGTPPTGPNVSDTDTRTVTAPSTPSIDLVKSASSATYNAGQTLTYTFVARNTGNVSLSNVSITDTGLPGVTINNASCTPAAPTTLAPNATLTCTATKAMTQADVNAGSVVNTARAQGTPPTGANVSDTDDETVTAPSTPAIDLVKTASSATYTAGQTLTYTFTARNTGNVSLSNVSITDTGLPGVTINNASCTPAAPATLAPNATLTCTATKTMTQADVNAGSVVNTARTQGTPPTGQPVTDTDTRTVTSASTPAIDLVKTASSATYTAGQTLTYTFTARNTGNVSLTNVSITDTGLPGVTINNASCTPAAPATLAPNATLTCTATKTMTQADVNAGAVVNTATTSGTPPTGPPVTDSDTRTVTAPSTPSIDLVKSASSATYTAGQTLTYTFTARNTGNVSLSNVSITDTGLTGVTITNASCTPAAPATLAPNATLTCTATKTMTQADVNAGSVVNTARTSGTPPTGQPVTDTDDETVTSTSAPSIDLIKSASSSTYAAGQTLTYTFVARNTGNVSLSNVSITDTGLVGVVITNSTCAPAAPATLAPNATLTCTATKTMTQADVNAGSVVNTARTSGTPPTGLPVTDTDDETVTAPPTPSIDLVKSASSATYTAGQTLTYTFAARNTGNVSLSNVSITDTGLTGVTINNASCTPAAPATLAPNATLTCTATKTMTQADVNAGSVVNTARTSGTPPTGPAVTDTDDETVTSSSTPSIDLTKSASSATYTAGQTLTYTFVARNTGNVGLSNVSITDTGLTGVTINNASCTPAAPATLAPNATLTCTATKTMTQADVNAGSVVNTARTQGTPPTGQPVSDTDDETVTAPPAPSIQLEKTADVSSYNVGDVVTYTFTARNTGNVSLTNVSITDTGLVGVTITNASCTPAAPATLAPNATLTCTATKTMTQADGDAGSVTNTATTRGTPPTGPPVTDTDDETVTFPRGPGITLAKTSDKATYVAGDVLTYTFVATNTGNLSLSNVTITDTGLPGVTINNASCTPAAPATLAPRATLRCTATKTMTQADVDAGSVVNTATTSGTPPTGPPVTDTDDDTVTSPATPSIDLVKTSSSATYTAGQTLTYTFLARNTGNVSLNNVSITDTGLVGVTINNASCTPAAPATLAPNATLRCTATKTMTQADVNAGSVVNTARTQGTPPTGPPVTDTDDDTVTATSTPSIDLVKTASSATYTAGQTLTYTFVARNTGNVSLSNVSITDTGLTGVTIDNASCTPAAPATLAPNATLSCTATKTMTQADVNAGAVVNTARASGTPPTGPAVTDSDDETVTSAPRPSIDLVKTASSATYTAGQTLTYTFVARNTGNVSLSNVSITDTGLTGVTITNASCTPAAPATLAPNATLSCTATKTMTQGDVNAGAVVNTARTQGTPPTGQPVSDTDDETVTAPSGPAIDLVKTASSATYAAGQTLTYRFVARNTGNVSLSNVSITDTGLAGVTITNASCTPAAPATLAPNATLTCTATKTMTQADVNAGSVVNTARTQGTPPTGPPVTDTDDETVTSTRTPSIDLVKTASSATYTAGQTLTYTFVARNTGNVSLSSVSITDTGLTGVTIDNASCTPAAPATLAPNATLTCTATKTMTQADVNAGSVVNTARTQGTPPTGPAVTDSDDETVTAPPTPSIQLEKTADERSYDAGDVVTYTFTARNTGNVSLTDVSITDTGLAGVTITDASCTPAAPATLAPNATLTCTATKTMTQADADAGSVTNTATTRGTPPTGPPVTDDDDETVTFPRGPGITLTKTADKATYVAGDVLTYTFVATNSGNVSLSGVSITDTGLVGVTIDNATCLPAAPATLAPGATLRCTATKTMTQADVDAGSVVNTATTRGTPPTGPPVTDSDDETVTSPPTPSINLVKSASSETYTAGQTLTYTFVARNTGNVSLSNVSITDTGLPGVTIANGSCTPAAPATLAPGATLSCTATKTMTQADVNSGAVVNTATTRGTPPTGPPVTDDDTRTVRSTATPSIGLVKSASSATYTAGQTLTYTFVATNTGNVSLSDVSITDTGLPGVTIDDATCTPAAPATLAPGATLTCTATKTMTQADVTAGSVVNTATTSGTPPTGPPVTDTDDETVTSVPPVLTPSIDLVKTASSPKYRAGETLTYTFVARNTGNVSLSDVSITDTGLPGVTVTDADCTPAAPATLAPNATLTCTATKTMTRDDVAAGSVVNTATTSGTPPTGPPVTDSDDETVRARPAATGAAEMTLVKTAGDPVDKNGNGRTDAGDTIRYRFLVTNTGTTTLTAVFVDDPKLRSAGVTVTCPQRVLAPGEAMTCRSGPYTVTAADARAGRVRNVATAQGGCSLAEQPDGCVTASSRSAATTPMKPPSPAPEPGPSPVPPPNPDNLPDTGGVDGRLPLLGLGLVVLGLALAFGGARRRGRHRDAAA